MCRSLVHTFNNLCFWDFEFDRFEEILRIVIMIRNLATRCDFVYILASMSLTRDIVNRDILTGVLDYLIDTFSEIVGYFLKSHGKSMP